MKKEFKEEEKWVRGREEEEAHSDDGSFFMNLLALINCNENCEYQTCGCDDLAQQQIIPASNLCRGGEKWEIKEEIS